MFDVVCPFKDKCVDYPWKCRTCLHNRGKKSYYQPMPGKGVFP